MGPLFCREEMAKSFESDLLHKLGPIIATNIIARLQNINVPYIRHKNDNFDRLVFLKLPWTFWASSLTCLNFLGASLMIFASDFCTKWKLISTSAGGCSGGVCCDIVQTSCNMKHGGSGIKYRGCNNYIRNYNIIIQLLRYCSNKIQYKKKRQNFQFYLKYDVVRVIEKEPVTRWVSWASLENVWEERKKRIRIRSGITSRWRNKLNQPY